MNKILIIEDDLEINALLADFLKEKGYAVHCQYDGLHVLDFLNKEKIDLIILDIMLPYRSGDIILSDVRKKFTIPVIIISAKETTQNKIDLLRLGADDYISKPFRPRELVSRMKMVIRRYYGEKDTLIKTGKLEIDTARGVVKKKGKDIALTSLEYRLLLLFFQKKGKVLSRNFLLEELWDIAGEYVNDNTLTVYIKRLREKVEDNPQEPEIIKTVRGLGYRMEE